LELIDLPERVESFLATVQRMAPGSLVTREQVQMKRREEPPSAGLDDPEPPSRQI
jgi:hypothetical protein